MLHARDYLGRLLATAWSSLSADDLEYDQVARALARADRVLTGGANLEQIRACFEWRDIDVASAAAHTPSRSIDRLLQSSNPAYRVLPPTAASEPARAASPLELSVR